MKRNVSYDHMRALAARLVARPLLVAVLASAAETEVLFDGTGAGDWTTARDEQRIARELALSELRTTPEPSSLQWRFVAKAGVGFNDIFLMRPIRLPRPWWGRHDYYIFVAW